MTKEQFLDTWMFASNPLFEADLEAVIATEIAKVQEAKPQEPKGNCSTFDGSRLVDQEKTALNPIAEAYERGEKVRPKKWDKGDWIKKYDNLHWIHSKGDVQVTIISLFENPHEWEIYTEPEQPANPFDRDRFERMFCAVVASGVQQNFECFKIDTTYFLQQLDAYYAEKEGQMSKQQFLEKAIKNKANTDLHQELIEKCIVPIQTHLGKESINHFLQKGKVSGSFLLALMDYAEQYHEAKTKLDAYYAEKGGNNG